MTIVDNTSDNFFMEAQLDKQMGAMVWLRPPLHAYNTIVTRTYTYMNIVTRPLCIISTRAKTPACNTAITLYIRAWACCYNRVQGESNRITIIIV